MDQPLFSCTRCLKSFPHSQMSRSGTTCKTCTPHHSSFKQCEFCKSDFKHSIPGMVCSRCQSLKTKYGDPQCCSICHLMTAFGNALVCQRCLHYRNKFGDPRQCAQCLQMCAFYKDEASRSKVDGQVLCWVCTYNFKINKSKERAELTTTKNRGGQDPYFKSSNDLSSLAAVKRQRTEDYTMSHSVTRPTGTHAYSMDSAYNEHILTISQLQDEVKALKRQLQIKDSELLKKDQAIALLKSDLIEIESTSRDRVSRVQHTADEDISRLKETIRQLNREKSELVSRPKKPRRSGHPTPGSGYAGSPLTLSPLRIPPKVTPARLTASASTSALPRRVTGLTSKETSTPESPPLAKPVVYDADSNGNSLHKRPDEEEEDDGDSLRCEPLVHSDHHENISVALKSAANQDSVSPSLSSSSSERHGYTKSPMNQSPLRQAPVSPSDMTS